VNFIGISAVVYVAPCLGDSTSTGGKNGCAYTKGIVKNRSVAIKITRAFSLTKVHFLPWVPFCLSAFKF
jgi:hypothetical protein